MTRDHDNAVIPSRDQMSADWPPFLFRNVPLRQVKFSYKRNQKINRIWKEVSSVFAYTITFRRPLTVVRYTLWRIG